MPRIVLENVYKNWGNYYAIDNLNLVIEDNSFISLLGPSGCGKTTTLRMIAGLETPTKGKITMDGVVVYDSEKGIDVHPSKRNIGFLFQNYALWPNMTVYQNIIFGLKNVKEEMVVVDNNLVAVKRIIHILKNAKKIIGFLNECFDKKGVFIESKALIALVDHYEISLGSAKTIYKYHFEKCEDPEAVAQVGITELTNLIDNVVAKYELKGIKFNDKFEQIDADGNVVKKVRKLDSEEIDLAVRRVSRIVKISEFMDRYPAELSGGQQQRVALARTMAPGPKILFMDEPLSNLDAKLRLEMRSELIRLHIDTKSTFIYVTHDQIEAMSLSTQICVLNNGVLQQYEEPLSIYKEPTNLFVADFVGNPSINFIEAVGKQNKDSSLDLSILEGKKVKFIPNKTFNIENVIKTFTEEKEKAEKAEEALILEGSRIEKINKDEVFKYAIANLDPNFYEKVRTFDYIIGVRPEFIKVGNKGIAGKIYSAMPTGVETTVKVTVGNYILTALEYGSILYTINNDTKIDFINDNILLFEKTTGRLIASGKIEIAD